MNETDLFFKDTWEGLNASPKRLSSKYFYDEMGDKIFTEIMACPEYYLTNCELDIFTNKGGDIADAIIKCLPAFDVAELGAGDCTKSVYLLRALMDKGCDYTFFPIDISSHVISLLDKKLPVSVPGIKLQGLNGDYFEMLEKAKDFSGKHKVVMFLGSSIGNILLRETVPFFTALRAHLKPGDLLLTGFDLQKDPAVILAAYNDAAGITKRFNLNLLARINKTLDADFDLTQFEHTPEYDPETGACKSYLVSKIAQRVRIGEVGWVHFAAGERIFMEVSQKYTVAQTDGFAAESGFKPIVNFYDSKEWFLDALWQVI